MSEEPPRYSQVAFLPWLRLARKVSVAGVSFVPLLDESGTPSPELAGAIDPLRAILASYVDRRGRPIDSCVVAFLPDRGWNLDDGDFDRVQWATTLLFLGCWAANDYCPRFGGPYINSTAFRLVWQRFRGDPVWVALVSRRRDGRTTDGGYKHGEVKFSAPLQCALGVAAGVDERLLKALDDAVGSVTVARLRSSLPFVTLANTDDDLMATSAEAILMGAAFEQLLHGGCAFRLGRKFSELFKRFGSVTVEEAKSTRPGIVIDTSRQEYADAQPKWWVHQKWMEELHNLRSRSVHCGTPGGRTWGWSTDEHLLMAAWVFPPVVKVLLEGEGHYTLTEEDIGRCRAVDKLLSIVGWGEELNDGPSRWHDVVSKATNDYKFDQSIKRALAEHPALLSGWKPEES